MSSEPLNRASVTALVAGSTEIISKTEARALTLTKSPSSQLASFQEAVVITTTGAAAVPVGVAV